MINIFSTHLSYIKIKSKGLGINILRSLLLLFPNYACSSDEIDYSVEVDYPVEYEYVYTYDVQTIAHRGYWNCEGSAQNSVTALRYAADLGIYGSEFDVRMTNDGVMVVNHDAEIDGKTIRDCEYEELENSELSNGECLPTLYDFLSVAQELPDIVLVLELKSSGSAYVEKEVEVVLNLVAEMNLQERVQYISFSLGACERIAQLSPTSDVAYLGGDIQPVDLIEKGINGISYEYVVLRNNPEWIEEAHELGMSVCAWVVNNEDDMKLLLDLGIDYITTDNPLTAMEIYGHVTILP